MKPFDDKTSQFHISSHTALNFTPEQSAEAIATHFSKISQEFSPLSFDSLSLNLRNTLESSNTAAAPYLSTLTVVKRICKARNR